MNTIPRLQRDIILDGPSGPSEKVVMRHQITCKYFQPRSTYINEDAKVWYTVDFKSETFIEALDYLKYIDDTCNGVITDVFIQKLPYHE